MSIYCKSLFVSFAGLALGNDLYIFLQHVYTKNFFFFSFFINLMSVMHKLRLTVSCLTTRIAAIILGCCLSRNTLMKVRQNGDH